MPDTQLASERSAHAPVQSAALPAASGQFRADIQALRAVAVALVVVFHAWPWLLSGGYVGVDVFFVISGFLITSHLLKEASTTGSVSLARFWARRARRLLPASLLVLAASSIATILVVPETLWRQFFRDITRATLYVLNWALAEDSVDYFAAENAPSPVQHFWSLSVEEQFYVGLPIVVVLVMLGAGVGNLTWRSTRRVLVAALALITLGSLAVSVALTASAPQRAYFVTPTRAWEFGVGCLLAFAPAIAARRRTRVVISWAGLLLILASAFTLDSGTPFPGWIAAAPVIGTVLVLAANDPPGNTTPMILGRNRAVQFLGAASYSLYLWHWPVLILWPYTLEREMTSLDRLLAVSVAVVLSAASLKLIEDPVRSVTGRWTSPRVALGGAIGAMSVVLVLTWLGGEMLERVETRAEEVSAGTEGASEDPCRGAPVMDPESTCFGEWPRDRLSPTPLTTKDSAVRPVCMTGLESADVTTCETGEPASTATMTVAVIGDSHAGHWRAAVDRVAAERSWRVVTMLKGSCPFTAATRATNDRAAANCREWNERALDELDRRSEVSAVFVSASSLNGFAAEEPLDEWQSGVQGYVDAWSSLPDTVEQVYVLRDIPRPRPDNVECLQELGSIERMTEYGACARPQVEAVLPDPLAAAAEQLPERATLIDVNDLFCDGENCLVVVGGTMVYRDGHHMTAAFAETLAPYVAQELIGAHR